MIGPSTEILAGNGLVLTAGGIDCHVHFICPQIVEEALGAGMTTLIGGGTGPAEGTWATTVTPGQLEPRPDARVARRLPRQRRAARQGEHHVARGAPRAVAGRGLGIQAPRGLGLDAGRDPGLSRSCRRDRGASGVALGYDERGGLRGGDDRGDRWPTDPRLPHRGRRRRPCAGHHRPRRQANVLPSSTNPTMPHTVNTVDEHLDMLMVCHHLNPRVPEDLAFAESRIRATTIAAEDILHDLGAISMIGSDSQAMGRAGEVVIRTWQTAHVMKARRGALPGDGRADNLRARRYVAKYTICPAVAHGLEGEVGSVEVGKLADLVLWHPGFFGVRPHVVVKGGVIAWAQMGDANASIPTPQPVLPRPMFGAAPRVAQATSVAFVAPIGLESGLAERLGLGRRLVPVNDVRRRGKADLVLNDALPGSPWTRTPSLSGSTARSSIPSRRRRCRWPSATSSSDVRCKAPRLGASPR